MRQACRVQRAGMHCTWLVHACTPVHSECAYCVRVCMHVHSEYMYRRHACALWVWVHALIISVCMPACMQAGVSCTRHERERGLYKPPYAREQQMHCTWLVHVCRRACVYTLSVRAWLCVQAACLCTLSVSTSRLLVARRRTGGE